MSRVKLTRETSNMVVFLTARRAIIAAALSLSLMFLSNITKDPDNIMITSIMKASGSEIILSGSIYIESIDDPTTIPYLKCGIMHPQSREILLLHGSAFTKDNWKDSGIMERICSSDFHEGKIQARSVIALDIPVTADGPRIYEVFLALKHVNLITGRPLVIVTPSASGKSILSLSSLFQKYRNSTNENEITRAAMLPKVLKAWIPIASYAVAREIKSLASFKSCKIPILALTGKDDDAGKGVSKLLVEFAGAEMIEMIGGHACYLDSPDAFARILSKFVDKLEYER